MRRKKILILSSTGGYGHVAASRALEGLLSDQYDIDTIYPIQELRIFGVPSGESFYNFLLKNNWNRLNNFIVRNIPRPLLKKREGKIAKIVENHVREKKSDLVISLAPFINYPASEGARASGAAFLIVTVDYGLDNWIYDLEKIKISNLKMTIGNKLSATKKLLLKVGFSEEMLNETDLPLRLGFLNPQSKDSLRQKYGILSSKNVVLIMMGGTGAKSSFTFAKILSQLPLNVHLIVCTGRVKQLCSKLKRLKMFHNNSLDVVPFTENVHELIGLSDLVITKPGPGTLNEILTLKVPVLIDKTRVPLFWERPSFDVVNKYKVGEAIESFNDLPRLVTRYLTDERLKKEIEDAFDHIPENTFAARIGPLIEEITKQPAEGKAIVSARSGLTAH